MQAGQTVNFFSLPGGAQLARIVTVKDGKPLGYKVLDLKVEGIESVITDVPHVTERGDATVCWSSTTETVHIEPIPVKSATRASKIARSESSSE